VASSSSSSSSSSSTTLPGVDPVRQLTVADYRAAESLPALSARPVVKSKYSRGTVAPRQEATLSLPAWIKQHKFLRAAPVERGEPSVALLLLWEADHGKPFPCRTNELAGRLTTFSKQLKDAVALDAALSAWLTCQHFWLSLAAGLPIARHLRWAVRIDPSVGDHFLGPWKAHLMELVRQLQSGEVVSKRGRKPKSAAAVPRSPRPGTKRKREGPVPIPPSHSQEARLGRLVKARRALEDQHGVHEASTSTPSSTSASQSGGDPASAAGPGLLPPGVIT
jgi:hypothetical protein